MLRSLKVRNFGVIEELEVELGPGLTVLTGETGAGKSLLLDALLLLAGGRADLEMVRAGCDEASVEGVFAATDELAERLAAAGVPTGEVVVVRRTLSAGGRGRAWVNGSAVNLSMLQSFMRGLIDLAGQLEHASLYDEENHRALVDRFGQLDAPDGPKATYVAKYEARRRLAARLLELGGDDRELRSKVDFLRFQLNELAQAAPTHGEEASLEAERRRLASAAKLEALATAVQHLISEREGNATDLIHDALHRASEMERFDQGAGQLRARVAAAAAELDECSRLVGRYLSSLDGDPGQLKALEERLDLLRALARKHGLSVDGLEARHQALAGELDQLERRGVLRAEVEQQLATCDAELQQAAALLTKRRRQAAVELEKKAREVLARLALPNARFLIELEAAPAGPSGADSLRFVFSANPGEPPRALAKVASGGEASRVMLALKAVLAATERVALSVLDEVDTGVGGAVGDVIGRLIRDLSSHRQVLCITHLPQVAAHAEQHLRLSKRVSAGRVQSSVEALATLTARQEELARMLSGVEVSREARAAASALLTHAARGEASVSQRRKRVVRAVGERRTA